MVRVCREGGRQWLGMITHVESQEKITLTTGWAWTPTAESYRAPLASGDLKRAQFIRGVRSVPDVDYAGNADLCTALCAEMADMSAAGSTDSFTLAACTAELREPEAGNNACWCLGHVDHTNANWDIATWKTMGTTTTITDWTGGEDYGSAANPQYNQYGNLFTQCYMYGQSKEGDLVPYSSGSCCLALWPAPLPSLWPSRPFPDLCSSFHHTTPRRGLFSALTCPASIAMADGWRWALGDVLVPPASSCSSTCAHPSRLPSHNGAH